MALNSSSERASLFFRLRQHSFERQRWQLHVLVSLHRMHTSTRNVFGPESALTVNPPKPSDRFSPPSCTIEFRFENWNGRIAKALTFELAELDEAKGVDWEIWREHKRWQSLRMIKNRRNTKRAMRIDTFENTCRGRRLNDESSISFYSWPHSMKNFFKVNADDIADSAHERTSSVIIVRARNLNWLADGALLAMLFFLTLKRVFDVLCASKAFVMTSSALPRVKTFVYTAELYFSRFHSRHQRPKADDFLQCRSQYRRFFSFIIMLRLTSLFPAATHRVLVWEASKLFMMLSRRDLEPCWSLKNFIFQLQHIEMRICVRRLRR